VLIPFEEVNGNWNPWSITVNNNSVIKHILAYRKIHDMLGDIPNLKFGWAVNNGSAPDTDENSIANLYPGSEYVDYVGVDGFNFDDPWQTFSEVFDEPLSILKGFNKPIMLFSMASAEGNKKPAWIDDLGVQILARPEIDGFVWFNENKEKDWRIWSDPQSLKAFQNMLDLMVPSEPIPDSQ
jgi:beta-mannanase